MIEVDASAIKGMLCNPDILPLVSVNQWIFAILTSHFHLVHVPGAHHTPNSLSHHLQQLADPVQYDNTEELDDWIDNLHGFLHQIIMPAHFYPSQKE